MSLTNQQLSWIREDLNVLHQAACQINGWDGKQSRTYIEVGEYGLALDDIAYAYLESNVSIPKDLRTIFNRLATTMELDKDPEYDGVARLRAHGG